MQAKLLNDEYYTRYIVLKEVEGESQVLKNK